MSDGTRINLCEGCPYSSVRDELIDVIDNGSIVMRESAKVINTTLGLSECDGPQFVDEVRDQFGNVDVPAHDKCGKIMLMQGVCKALDATKSLRDIIR